MMLPILHQVWIPVQKDCCWAIVEMLVNNKYEIGMVSYSGRFMDLEMEMG